jgi:hypothetical protein
MGHAGNVGAQDRAVLCAEYSRERLINPKMNSFKVVFEENW